MKHFWCKLLCKLGFHFKRPNSPQRGFHTGLINSFGSGYRVDYYDCKFCKKDIHWSVKVDY